MATSGWWSATVLFLFLNDVDLQAPSDDEGEAFVLDVAAGHADPDEITPTIALWSGPVST
jgi:prophage maintenance system killer protein